MRTIGITIWVTAMAYATLCIGIREIRIIYWRGTRGRMVGAVSYVGVAILLWWPVLRYLLGLLIPKEYLFVSYGFVILAFVFIVMGYLMDISD